MRTLRTAAALATLAFANQLGAQTTIRVVDRDSVPIPYALVLVGSTPGRATGLSGEVRLPEALRGQVDLRVQRIGYQPFQRKVAAPTQGGEILVQLSPLAMGIDTVRAVASRETPTSRTGFYDRMERVRNGAITGEFITPEELQQRNPQKISDILRGRRSVTVARLSGDASGRMTALGRGGNCNMTVLLDGTRVNGLFEKEQFDAPTSMVRQGSRGSGAGVSSGTGIGFDEITAVGAVMAIEIYPSMANAPAELVPLTGGGSCGIIALWTGQRR
jgi:hypothetical protein